MIFISVMRTKILEYFIESLFTRIQNNFNGRKLLSPGLKVSKIISISKKADYDYFKNKEMNSEIVRGNILRTISRYEYRNCVLCGVDDAPFMGEIIRVIKFYEERDPEKIYSESENDIEIIY